MTLRNHVLLLVCLLTGLAWIFPQTLPAQEMESREPIWLRPNVELPAQVKAEPGKLTLFADFEHPNFKFIPLYVVNRTQEKVRLSSRQLDMLIKLERQLPDGGWERVESSREGGCGVSDGPDSLPPGMHLRHFVEQVSKGENGLVRYSFYGDLAMSSNAAPGLFDPVDRQAALTDELSMRGLSSAFLVLGNPLGSQLDSNLSRNVTGLSLAALTGDLPTVRAAGEKWIEALAALPSPTAEQKLALQRGREILGFSWSGRPNLILLLERCLTAVRNNSATAAAFGTPEKERDLAWELIAACGVEEISQGSPHRQAMILPERSIWKNILSLAAAQATTASEEEAARIAWVLSIAPLADEILPDEIFENLLASPSESLMRVASVTLARRCQWERMAVLAKPLRPDRQLEVFMELTQARLSGEADPDGGKKIRIRPEGKKEQAFWDLVLRTQTLQASKNLYYSLLGGENRYWRAAFGELLAFWEREAARSQAASKDFPVPELEGSSDLSVCFIGAWQDPRDIPLLRSLLIYRGYTTRISSLNTNGAPSMEIVYRVFNVRRHAAEALKKMGETLPENLVLEVEISRNPEARNQ